MFRKKSSKRKGSRLFYNMYASRVACHMVGGAFCGVIHDIRKTV